MSIDRQGMYEEAPPLSPGEQRLLDFFAPGALKGSRLHQFEKYAIGAYRIPQALHRLCDTRKEPKIPTFAIVNALFHAAIWRLPSLNALEEQMREDEMQRFLGHRRGHKRIPFSADTVSRSLDGLEIAGLHTILKGMIARAERNKCFRDDTYGTFRCVALDGWEPFSSYTRHCKGCLSRQVTVLDEDGKKTKVTQYYHRYAVAILIAPKLDMTLGIEPVLSQDLRSKVGEEDDGHEGELSAALRLIDRLHRDYGSFIDAFALDGLYPCGPVFEKLKRYKYGAFINTKNKRNDPYRFANEVWEAKGAPDQVIEDGDGKQTRKIWELKDVDTLKTFDGSVDMVKIELTTRDTRTLKKDPKRKTPYININAHKRRPDKVQTWVFAKVGKAKNVNNRVSEHIVRARWHIENTAFHQWVTHWNLDHCYRHTPEAVTAILHIWALAFNLMQLFFYKRLKKQRKGRPSHDTIAGCVRSLWGGIYSFHEPVPWYLLDDTG